MRATMGTTTAKRTVLRTTMAAAAAEMETVGCWDMGKERQTERKQPLYKRRSEEFTQPISIKNGKAYSLIGKQLPRGDEHDNAAAELKTSTNVVESHIFTRETSHPSGVVRNSNLRFGG